MDPTPNESLHFGPGYGGPPGYGPPPGGYGPPPGGGFGPPPGGYGPPPGGFGPPPPGFPPGGPMGPMGPMGMPPSQGLAVASLVCGILSILLNCACCAALGLPLAIAAAVMGGIAMSRASSQPQLYGGKGLAIGGLATGIGGLVFGILMFALGFGLQMLNAVQND